MEPEKTCTACVEGGTPMKRMAVMAASVLLAITVAAGVSTIDPPAAEAAGGGYVKKCGGGKIFLNAKEKRSFTLHNKARTSRGMRALCVHPALQKAARAHSKSMVQRDYFTHGDVGSRLKRYGYNWRTYGENIAWGQGTRGNPGPIFRSWMNSSGHRSNILNRRFREVGIGTYTGRFKGYRNVTMYTADFGARR